MLFGVTLPNTLRQSHAHESAHPQSLFLYAAWALCITAFYYFKEEAENMKPSKDFALEVHFAKWEFKARYNIGGSDLQSMTLPELLELADPEDRKAWESLYLGYTETAGAPELRQVIADTYDQLNPENILCFAGAEEGIFCAMHALLKPGDHALVCFPNYQSAESIPQSICEVTGISLDPENNWTINIDTVRSQIRPNTKLISVNFPNNPTGKILEPEKFEALIELCREHDIYLFSDEVYRLIERDPSRRLPQAADIYEKAFSLNVMSKAYGLAGIRIGWIASQDCDLLRSMERMKHYLSICNSGPSEIIATIALKNRSKILEKNRSLVDHNLMLLDQFFSRHPDLFDWQTPDGGCIGFPKYKGKDGVVAFTEHLVQDAGIILIPSSLYRSELGKVPIDRFRIGYGRDYLGEALAVLEEHLLKK